MNRNQEKEVKTLIKASLKELMVRQCCECKMVMGTKLREEELSGATHGYCGKCEGRMKERLQFSKAIKEVQGLLGQLRDARAGIPEWLLKEREQVCIGFRMEKGEVVMY